MHKKRKVWVRASFMLHTTTHIFIDASSYWRMPSPKRHSLFHFYTVSICFIPHLLHMVTYNSLSQLSYWMGVTDSIKSFGSARKAAERAKKVPCSCRQMALLNSAHAVRWKSTAHFSSRFVTMSGNLSELQTFVKLPFTFIGVWLQ